MQYQMTRYDWHIPKMINALYGFGENKDKMRNDFICEHRN